MQFLQLLRGLLRGHACEFQHVGSARFLHDVSAMNFLIKPVKGSELLACVEEAIKQCAILQKHAIASQVIAARLAMLTEREREVLDLLAQGMTNKEISETLYISANTVKRHLKAIFEKLDIHTRSAAAAKAIGAASGLTPGE